MVYHDIANFVSEAIQYWENQNTTTEEQKKNLSNLESYSQWKYTLKCRQNKTFLELMYYQQTWI